MKGFAIHTPDQTTIRFKFYIDEAPVTCKAFSALLPFTRTFFHARVSGEEIWIDNVPPLDIIQENASVFTEPGEVVFGPLKPFRAKTSNCMGIYYGEGKGLLQYFRQGIRGRRHATSHAWRQHLEKRNAGNHFYALGIIIRK